MEILKYKIVCILILCGVILCLAFLILTNVFCIIPKSNIAIGFGLLTPMPAYIGLFIYSRKIKEQQRGLSRIIIRVVFILVASFLASSITAFCSAIH